MSKVVVITGAGKGLGREIARRLAADGDTVVLLGRTLSKVEEVADALGSPALAIECDVASPDSVRAAFAAIAERHPRIDVLVNNAAVYTPFRIADASDAQILSSISINVAGPIYCTRAAIPLMGRGGHIINVSSESVGMLFPMLSMYQSSKAAVERMSEALQHELEPDGIRVTCVRAGQMMAEGASLEMTPETGLQFYDACRKAGVDLAARPISPVEAVTGVFRHLIDLPAALHVALVTLHARKAN